mgnify:CR=1 FL=1
MVLILDGSDHIMLHMHEGKYVFSDKKCPICDCSGTNPKPYTGHITEIAPNYELPSNVSTMILYYDVNLAHGSLNRRLSDSL